MRVGAYDTSYPNDVTTDEFTITVLRNQNGPVFQPGASYVQTVSDNLPLFAKVETILATDKDQGVRASDFTIGYCFVHLQQRSTAFYIFIFLFYQFWFILICVFCFFQDVVTYRLINATSDGLEFFYLDANTGEVFVKKDLADAKFQPYIVSSVANSVPFFFICQIPALSIISTDKPNIVYHVILIY